MTAPRRLLIVLAALAAVGGAHVVLSRTDPPASAVSHVLPEPAPVPRVTIPPSTLSERQRIVHVLNRAGYGPRPGDIERVQRMGLAAYLDRQLDPARIPDDAVEARLRSYRTIGMSAADLAREYPAAAAPRAVVTGAMAADADAAPGSYRPYPTVAELAAARLVRAVLSERQLQEVMVDFWFNHFNVFGRKGAVRFMLPDYEREAIRPHALGRFRDLARATAWHPAMLYYLDNWMSARADSRFGSRLGLNENYARELMELHTLGVDGGYTQQDVVEVARCFTGWSIDGPRRGGGFVFRSSTHDRGQKQVLGRVIWAGGGLSDGLQVIDVLARHPSTAHFIATKLARRFVSDDPPPALVDRAARAFRDSDGDIRTVLAAIFSSPELFSPAAYRAKVKTPLELVASAVRAVGSAIAPGPGSGLALARRVADLGQPLYLYEAAIGYADVAEAWVNAGALVDRMNFAGALAGGRVPGVRIDVAALLAGADRSRLGEARERLFAQLLDGEAAPATRAALEARTPADPEGPATYEAVEALVALILGSPDFQRK